MIRRRAAIREAYQDAKVADGEIDERFRQPLGMLLHDRQVSFLSHLITEQRPGRVLEIAPGPARVTAAVASHLPCGAMVIDASAAMLAQAKSRLIPLAAWQGHFVQGDA